MSHPNEIELGGIELTDQSYEIARLWVTHNAGSSVWVDARVLEQPRDFGFLIADAIRHAAFAYSQVHSLDRDEVVRTIAASVAEELEQQLGKENSTQDGTAS